MLMLAGVPRLPAELRESGTFKEMLLYLTRILTQSRDIKVISTLISPGHCNLQSKSGSIQWTKVK